MNLEKIAKAIEDDAGQAIPGLRESLQQMDEQQYANTHRPEQILVRAARNKLELSQSEFAELINTPVTTIRDWEQGRFAPPGGVQCLMRIALKHPGIVKKLAA